MTTTTTIMQILYGLCGLGMLIGIALIPEGPFAKIALAVMAVGVTAAVALATPTADGSTGATAGSAITTDENHHDGDPELPTDDVMIIIN